MSRQIARFFSPLALALVLATGCNTAQSPEQPVGQQIDDTAITASVKSQLATDVELSTITGIEVNTTNGVVTLSGQVSTAEIKSRVGAIAQNVDGVVRVTNNVQVSGL